jgi:hypothetical protein
VQPDWEDSAIGARNHAIVDKPRYRAVALADHSLPRLNVSVSLGWGPRVEPQCLCRKHHQLRTTNRFSRPVNGPTTTPQRQHQHDPFANCSYPSRDSSRRTWQSCSHGRRRRQPQRQGQRRSPIGQTTPNRWPRRPAPQRDQAIRQPPTTLIVAAASPPPLLNSPEPQRKAVFRGGHHMSLVRVRWMHSRILGAARATVGGSG